jgi:TolB protein
MLNYKYLKIILTRSLIVLLGLILFSTQAKAQKSLEINIFGPGQRKVNIHLVKPMALNADSALPEAAGELFQLLEKNLDFLPFLKQIPTHELLGEKNVKGVKARDIDFKRFRMSRVDLLLTVGWKDESNALGQAELRLFEVFQRKLVLGKGYRIAEKAQLVSVANRFCAQLMEELAGTGDFFRSKLAYVNKESGSKDIFICTPQGYNKQQITDMQSICMSPDWSWDNRLLAFTNVTDDGHALRIWNRESGKIKRILLPGNTIIGPAFMPNGRLAVSLDPHGNPDIYRLKNDWRFGEALIKNWAIDISPQFDRSGNKMVFVSSRLGNPHIFLYNLQSKDIERISFEGTYNTGPAISPDGRYVAYSRLTDDGHRIILHDLRTGIEEMLTSGPGNDEDPAWSPDGYFLAFSSNRTGKYKLYITTRHGDEPQQIDTGSGEATAPAWSQPNK